MWKDAVKKAVPVYDFILHAAFAKKSGVELLYRNEHNQDLALYYDDKTFRAFEAVSPRPHFDAPPAIDVLLDQHQQEVWEMLRDPKTHIYVAGTHAAAEKFEEAMKRMSGSLDAWRELRAQLEAEHRYSELLY
ncbi:MAG: hypothetical protein HYZ37_18100 [Candidatus Solibacter usitatus]|nr:hypothetical protein [Candidatus Solibacter usitatus]